MMHIIHNITFYKGLLIDNFFYQLIEADVHIKIPSFDEIKLHNVGKLYGLQTVCAKHSNLPT